MGTRHGVGAEVLISLALIMFTATSLLIVIFLETHQARIEALHPLLGRGFLAKIEDPAIDLRGMTGGAWWRVHAGGAPSPLGETDSTPDTETLALGAEARKLNRALVRSGAPWAPLSFAAPDASGPGIVIARIDPPISGLTLAGLIVVDVLVFGLFGFTLIRRRVADPITRLVAAVRGMSEGESGHHVPVEGAREIAELATAFNDMEEKLAARTGALEKAVADLRGANAHLSRAREGLDRAERLAMVGSMAAGVAHEVGNPMGALLAFLDVAERDSELSPEAKHCLSRATEQGERVRLILRQLLDFSRPPQVQHVALSMARVAAQAIELVGAQRKYAAIELGVQVEDDLPEAWGDESMASQILLNLVLNAASALESHPERGAIQISVETLAERSRSGDDSEQWRSRSTPDHVVCWVEDSGPGVSSDARERIFDPFFTTKAPGEGTGLGLANARRLAEEMGGWVTLDAEISVLGGARFGFALTAHPPETMDSGVTNEAGGITRARAEVRDQT